MRADAPLDATIENLVDGAFFNAGQSCCAVERIYVHRDVYDDVRRRLRRADTPVPARQPARAGDHARADGARRAPPSSCATRSPRPSARAREALIDPREFPGRRDGTPYLAPQVLVDVDHRMRVMTEETFGPVVGIMAVTDDDEAVALMNDSRYGLTASIWTTDATRPSRIGDRVETGTWYLNRCDYLDPALAWTGVKDSGRGCSLSRLGYEALTRPKSFHLPPDAVRIRGAHLPWIRSLPRSEPPPHENRQSVARR